MSLPTPKDPLIADLVRRSVSRRGFLRTAGVGGAALAGAPLLAACGTPSAKQEAGDCTSQDLSSKEKTLKISNWPLYIDQARETRNGQKVTVYPTLEQFERKTGISVDYTTDVNDNAEFFGIVRNQLAECEPTGRDIMVLTDYMAGRMINLGWIQQLDKSKIPNVNDNMLQNLRSPTWDPKREYSAPWQSGLTGIAYNKKLTKPVSSFEELISRPDLKGKVSLLSEMPDTMLFMLRIIGANPEDFTADEFSQAIDRLRQAVDAGQIRAFTGNEYAQDLVKGNVVACEAWSGDVIQLKFSNPDIEFVTPEEGLSLWSDNMLVPNKAEHKTNAEKWMNYYYEPQVAAEVAAWVNYICPVEGAREAMAEIDPSLADNPLIFPDSEQLAKTYDFMGLDQKTEQEYQQQFASVIGA